MSVAKVQESKKDKKVKGAVAEVLSWRQKKATADEEEEAIAKDVEDLITWTSLIEAMDEQQLKDYVLNRPENMQSVKTGKGAPGKRVQRSGKPKCSSASHGLMATIWKFHREDD
ncbi:uncharacterized protein LOC131230230 [Magnolia sinica]|uniref:uncharacterized protein LOC131230230 n=1 Tax=Magnolia sinica TaxID=86752 RepID=UPI002659D825|nr:uncharacterized protein LOC131230230 [Magnolia sinica]